MVNKLRLPSVGGESEGFEVRTELGCCLALALTSPGTLGNDSGSLSSMFLSCQTGISPRTKHLSTCSCPHWRCWDTARNEGDRIPALGRQ